MPSMFKLRHLFTKKSEEEPQPPPYWSYSYIREKANSPYSDGPSYRVPKPDPYSHLCIRGILTSSTPQWLWTNADCRAWLFAVLTNNLGYTKQRACDTAMKFKGFGPYMWSMDGSQWRVYLGTEEGHSLFNLMVSLSKNEGAVPRGYTFDHLQTEWELERKSQ